MGYLDELPQTAPPAREREPLIDVIESPGAYRVVVLLPGVQRDDVRVTALPRSIRVEVTKKGVTYSKEMPCTSPPTRIEVVSERARNSVVELVFRRVRRRR